MRMRRADPASIVSGMAIIVLGTLLLLDQAGELAFDFGSLTPAFLGVVGVILLACGLARGAPEE